MSRVYTLDQVAEQLQIKPSWLRTQCERREVPFTMLGGSYRFTPEHVEAIVRAFEEQPKGRRPKRSAASTSGRAGSVARLEPKTPARLRSAGN